MSQTKHAGGHAGAGDAGAGHELSDLKPRTIAVFGLVLAAVVAGCLVAAGWMFDLFGAYRAKRDVPPSLLARVQPPAGPLLQVNAPADMARLRAEEEAILSTYDWVDRGAGIVRIPIEQAMRLLVERGAKSPAPKAR